MWLYVYSFALFFFLQQTRSKSCLVGALQPNVICMTVRILKKKKDVTACLQSTVNRSVCLHFSGLLGIVFSRSAFLARCSTCFCERLESFCYGDFLCSFFMDMQVTCVSGYTIAKADPSNPVLVLVYVQSKADLAPKAARKIEKNETLALSCAV